MPDFHVVPTNQLCSHQLSTWSDLQQADPALDSAFFRPEYVQMVAAVRNDVQVAVLQEGRRTVGFFPFQQNRRNVAQAVGGRLSEFQGVVADESVTCCAEDLVLGSGISVWNFDHLIATQKIFRPFHWRSCSSPYMDLSRGFDAYLEARHEGLGTYRGVLRKARKLQRELGPLRFEFHTRRPEALEALLQWKSMQYQRTKTLQILRFPWIVKLLKRLQATQTKQFAGVVSALYVGDRLIAVHHGIRSRRSLHIWFPAFDRTYEKYSPGLILLVHLAKAAAEEGIERIDLGKGLERYKGSFKTGDVPMAVGAVDTRPVIKTLRRKWQDTKNLIRSHGGGGVLGVALGLSNRFREWQALQ